MKVCFTPHYSSFEESYKNRKYFENVKELIKYLITYQKENFHEESSITNYKIQYYAYAEKLKKDRFIIIYKNYSLEKQLRFPIGFMHYE